MPGGRRDLETTPSYPRREPAAAKAPEALTPAEEAEVFVKLRTGVAMCRAAGATVTLKVTSKDGVTTEF